MEEEEDNHIVDRQKQGAQTRPHSPYCEVVSQQFFVQNHEDFGFKVQEGKKS